MKLLIVGSCTGAKDLRDCPRCLHEEDFEDPVRLKRRETELAHWMLPAALLYTGWQHKYMMRGVEALRQTFGTQVCSLCIISAGYGLVAEDQYLAPYEATFQGKDRTWIGERSTRLGIPKSVRDAVCGYPLVLFLLGKEYLLSIEPPLIPAPDQRFIFLSNTAIPSAERSMSIKAGRNETKLGAGIVALKGKMFELFSIGLIQRPELWQSLLSDETSMTFMHLIEIASGQTFKRNAVNA